MHRRKFIRSIASTAVAVPVSSTLSWKHNRPSIEQDYDLVVYGTTPGGVACAVRAAREGLGVLLISFNDRIGGMLTSGLGVWDTLYEGYRSPIYNELRQTLFDYYKSTYGKDSETYRRALPGESGHNNGTFEAHVAERFINEMVKNEKNISVLYNHYPESVAMEGKNIKALTLRRMDGRESTQTTASYFADCSYEGDLMTVAKVAYRVGREAKEEYNEDHAGKVYMEPKSAPQWSDREERVFNNLNFRHFGYHQRVIYPESTHEADDRVQAYNMRYYVTNDPNNQIKLTPSDRYDPEYLKTLEFPRNPAHVIKPNGKYGTNRPQLVGMHNAYVEGDWPTRRKVIDEHIRLTRDMLYWVQNHPDAPEAAKKNWKGWGFAADEFVDNNNNPYEIYVREARRLVGHHVYTENDLALHDEYDRTPLHTDSIGIVEWYQDCHACTFEKVPAGPDKMSLHEGKMMIHKDTFIGQFPYRSIVPKEVDNLLVPVCASTSHVAWGAFRLEPTWMQIGESAAYAFIQANEERKRLADIDTEKLVRKLAEKRSMVTFFNDFYVDGSASWIPAVQYFGTKGFFPEYDAKADRPLDESTAQRWVEAASLIKEGQMQCEALIGKLAIEKESPTVTWQRFNELLNQFDLTANREIHDEVISRGQACEHLYQQV